MSSIIVKEDRLEWLDYHISATGFDLEGPEPSRDKYPSFAIFQELASMGKSGASGEPAHVAIRDLYLYACGEGQEYKKLFYDLGLPDVYTGPVFLEASGALAVHGMFLKLWYPESISRISPYGDRGLSRRGMKLHVCGTDIPYTCSPPLFALAEAVDAFNTSAKKSRKIEDVLIDIARIKKLAQDADAICDDILVSERIVEAGKIILDVQGDDNLVSIKPEIEIEGQPHGAFTQKFGNRITVGGVYNLDEPAGRTRLVLSKPQQEVLKKIKHEMQNIRDPEVFRKLLANPPQEFDDVDIDVSLLYSERVKAFGIYRPKTYPFICPYQTEWLPGIIVEGIDGRKSLFIKDSESLANLEEAIRDAERNGRDYAEYSGERIDLETARKTVENARTRLEGEYSRIEEAAKQLKVLIIEENIDALEYQEGSASLPLDEVECTIQGLDPAFSLKQHQKEGVARLMALYKAKYPGAILADDMGLGKTIQALSFLEYLGQQEEGVLACIILPVGLIGIWMDEYRRCFPDGVLIVKSAMGDMSRMLDIRERRDFYKNAVFLFSYDMMRRKQLDVCAVHWDIAILDEAQRIKTPGTLVTNAAKALMANFKVAMTGTPVENTFHDLWCISDFCLPGFLGSARDFAYEFNPSKDDSDEAIYKKGEELRMRLGKRLLRRIKDDVLTDLPPKFESDNPSHSEYFQKTPTVRIMPDMQRSAYDNVIRDYRRRKDSGEITGKRGILDVLHKLKSACEHPAFVRVEDASLPLERIDESAKAQSLIEILDSVKTSGEKAIVFAEYRRTQRFLAAIIHERYGIRPSIVNGETPVGFDVEAHSGTRLGIVKTFNQKPGFDVVIMSPVAAGVGLTVTGANHVIHFSRHWNPSKEDQATDRAYRIGQVRPVYVYYLIARHPDKNISSFDDNLARLLSSKRNMRGAVLYPSERVEVKPEDVLGTVLSEDERQ